MNRFLSLICVLCASALVSFHEAGVGVEATTAPTTSATFEYNTGTQVFGSLSINYAQYVDGARVRINGNYQIYYDTLYLQYYGGASVSATFDVSTGTLVITGTATGVEYARILNSVYFKTTSRQNLQRTVVWNLGANVVYSSSIGHYYLYISTSGRTPLTWQSARSDCSSRTHLTMTGYLATITTSEENSFVASVSSSAMAWVGASAASDGTTWR